MSNRNRYSLHRLERSSKRRGRWVIGIVCFLVAAWVVIRVRAWNYPVFFEQEEHSFVEHSIGWELRSDILGVVSNAKGGRIRQVIFFRNGDAAFDDRGQVFEFAVGESGAEPGASLLWVGQHPGDPRAYRLSKPYSGP